MISEFKSFIKENKLFSKKEKVLLAVSGGVDSVVMCHLFKKAKYNFALAHCNFQLRDEEANADEAFVKELAKELEVPVFVTRFETQKYAKEHKFTIQEAARELRYQWFEEIRETNEFEWIATAHQRDDSVETFMLNLVRGTGIAGLHGILEKKGRVVRPLLFATKDQIVEHSEKNKIVYREDSSNKSNKYSRNKVRNKVLPLLREVNHAADVHIAKEIKWLRNVEGIYQRWMDYQKEWCVEKKGKEVRVSIEMLQTSGFPEALLFEILKPYGFHGHIVDDIVFNLGREAGKLFYSADYELLKDRDCLILRKKPKKKKKSFQIEIESELVEEPLELEIKTVKKDEKFKIPAGKKIACLDRDQLEFPLTIRKWKRGDYFFPLGMRGKKKLSDFFIDNKFSRFDKDNTWLLASGNKIVWVIGHRVDNRFKIGSDTKNIYLLTVKSPN